MRMGAMALALGLGLMTVTATPARAEREHQPFTANGTVLRIVPAATVGEARNTLDGQLGAEGGPARDDGQGAARRYAAFRTNDISGEYQIIWVDLSWLKDSDFGRFIDLEEPEAVQIELVEQPDGSFLATQYWELVKGSQVNNTDWGVSEGYNSRDDSINARVDNGPDDDEARAQGDTFDVQGRRIDDDD